MTALERALELPDEPRRARGWAFALPVVAAWIAVAVVASRVFALGGYRSPVLIVGSLLAVPAALLAWFIAALEPRRTAITAAAMALALLFVPVATHGATPSTGRLAQIADGLGLPGKVVRDHRLGNGRCRSACSEIRRVQFADGQSLAAVRFDVSDALKSHNYAVTLYPHGVGQPTRLDAARGKILVSIELRPVTADRVRIAAIFLAQGPAPDTSVG